MHLPWCIPANGVLEPVDLVFSTRLELCAAHGRRRAQKLKHSTHFDETIQ